MNSLPAPLRVLSKASASIVPDRSPLWPSSFPRLPQSVSIWARLIVAVLPMVAGMLLCSILTVLGPLQSSISPYSYLLLVVFILFSPVEDRVGAVIESLLLNLLGVVVGIGWSQLALKLAVVAQRADLTTTAPARGIKGLFYALLTFASGMAHVGSDRVRRAAKLAAFLGTWMLTRPQYLDDLTADLTLPFLYTSLLAIGASTVCGLLVFPSTANGALVRSFAVFFRYAQDLLLITSDHFTDTTGKHGHSDYRIIQRKLSSQADVISSNYSESIFEASISRVSTDELKPLLAVVRRLKSIFATGMVCHTQEAHPDSEKSSPPVERLCHAVRKLVAAINASFDMVSAIILHPYGRRDSLDRVRKELHSARDRFVGDVQAALDVSVICERLRADTLASKRDLCRSACFTTSLLQMSYDAERSLDIAEHLLAKRISRPRLILPALDSRLFGRRERSSGVGELFAQGHDVEEEPDAEKAQMEVEDGPLLEDTQTLQTFATQRVRWPIFPSLSLTNRRRLKRTMLWIEHSQSLRFAIKNAVGCTLLALPSFLPLDSAGVRWWIDWRAQWVPISFIFVLTYTTGDTIRLSLFRIAGTIAGVGYALLIWVICRANPYGLVVMLTAVAAPWALIIRSPYAVASIVFMVTLPPIALAQYLGLSEERSVPRIALERGTDVIIGARTCAARDRELTVDKGIVAAVVLTHLLWPTYAHRDYLATVSKALEDLSRFYLSLSRQNLRPDDVYHPILRSRFEAHESDMHRRIMRLHTLMQIEHLEYSLMPRPHRLYKHIIDRLDTMTELLISLRFIRMHLPRRIAVNNVRSLRAEVVSAVHLSLFACTSAFRSGRPLPAFLPSPRLALEELETAIHLGLTELSSPNDVFSATSSPRRLAFALPESDEAQLSTSHEMANVFALSEGEILWEVVDALEFLVDVTRAFFGTSHFTEDHIFAAGLEDDEVALSAAPSSSSVSRRSRRKPTWSSGGTGRALPHELSTTA